MTASAADRKSFGCSNEAEFTYFGRALFEQELSQKRDFVRAFEAARQRIRDREAAEDKETSLPQISTFPAIEEKLSELIARLPREPEAPALSAR